MVSGGLELRSVDRYKAFIFDLDGTLVDSMGFYLQAWQAALGEAGYKISAEEVYEREGERADITAIEVIKEQSGKRISSEMAWKIVTRRDEEFAKIYSHRLMPGAIELLTWLKNSGKKLSLVTGSHNVEKRFLDLPDFLTFFDNITGGNDTTKGKPFPEPFLHAIAQIQELPEDCLAIENAPYGIRSAVGAGLRCIAIKGTSPLEKALLLKAGASRIFESLAELGQELKG